MAHAAVRALHDAPLPPWPRRSVDELASQLDRECEWLIANDVLPVEVIARNRELAETVLRSWTPVFIHGDLQVDHVFVVGDEISGVIDWSEASQGDAIFDLATLTLGHPEHLSDVVAGYGKDIDRYLIRAWWSLRCLSNVRWLNQHGYGDFEDFPEVATCAGRELAARSGHERRARDVRCTRRRAARGHEMEGAGPVILRWAFCASQSVNPGG